MTFRRKKTRCGRHPPALARIDVLCIGAGAALLLLGGAGLVRQSFIQVRLHGCAAHQRSLYQGFQGYAQDHFNGLPVGQLNARGKSESWDSAIFPYVKRLAGVSDPYRQFQCPSDAVPRPQPRSYAMTFYDPVRYGWPPRPDSHGGLGLYVDADRLRVLEAHAPEDPARSSARSMRLPALRFDMVPDPKGTGLLVESISADHFFGQAGGAAVECSRDQFNTNGPNSKTSANLHGGRLNYLMADGHVETLHPWESVGWAGDAHGGIGDHFGLWSLRPDD